MNEVHCWNYVHNLKKWNGLWRNLQIQLNLFDLLNAKCLLFLINDRVSVASYHQRLESVVQKSCCYEMLQKNHKTMSMMEIFLLNVAVLQSVMLLRNRNQLWITFWEFYKIFSNAYCLDQLWAATSERIL